MLRVLVLFALAATLATAGSRGPVTWKKHVSSGAFSFHYPSGWRVKEQDSTLAMTSPRSQEELLILALPFDARRSPQELGRQMVDLLKSSMPDLQTFGFQESGLLSASFQCRYTEAGTRFRSEVLVVKQAQAAHWFSYSAPEAGYDQAYGLELLQGMVGSIAAGSGSQPPAARKAIPTVGVSSLETNARAFLFVLEFTLGAPLNHTQERLILDELLAGWRRETPEALKKYDLYPQVVAAILGGKQHELESLRTTLEESTREWLEESDPDDRVVRVVKTQLEGRNRTLAAGPPPLTDMAATAYAELTTYAALLASDGNAALSSLPAARVEAVRQRLQGDWARLSPGDREDVQSAPGLWITFRTLLQHGSAAEKVKIRTQLLRLVPAASAPAVPSRPIGMVEHNVLMNLNQMTFNSYMWSRGFRSTSLGY